MKIERCDICDELTGRAGRTEDSIVCVLCDNAICEECVAVEDVDGNPICIKCNALFFE